MDNAGRAASAALLAFFKSLNFDTSDYCVYLAKAKETHSNVLIGWALKQYFYGINRCRFVLFSGVI
jgi:hypothetical protein